MTFYVSVSSTGEQGQYPVTIYEQWKQPNAANSQQFDGSTDYYASVYSASAVSAYAIVEDLVAAIIVIAIVIVIYKRIAKNKHKNMKIKR